MMLAGISLIERHLDKISTITMKIEPHNIVQGKVNLLSFPHNNLAICGIARPIQLIVPLTLTETAVKNVVKIITIILTTR